MNPEILTEQDKRLLSPSAPGVITNLEHAIFMCTTTIFAAYAWRKVGFAGFLKPLVVLPLVGTWVGFSWINNELRELSFSSARGKMVARYTNEYGPKFLLDVLDPTFRLPEDLQSK
jgi:hypothetical protein